VKARVIRATLVIAGVLLAGCSQAGDMSELKPPPGVTRFNEERSFDAAVASAETDLLLAMRETYGRQHAERWKVPLDQSWNQLVQYYAEQLGPGWKVDPRISGQGSGYERRVWRREGSVGRPAAVAIAHIEVHPADFAVMIVAQSATD
jgi:hypothetical protein